MANVQKYTRGQIGGLTRHFERGQKEDGSYFQFGNQDIDTSKSHLNYNLAPEHDGGQLSFIGRRTSEVQCLKRADVNVMCSWVVTAPKDLTEGEYDLFFREAYKFLNDRYANGSDKNVISAYVHMDEISPHLHYAFVPVVNDKKKGIDKVSAKIAVDRLDLQKFHQDLEQRMAEFFGREIGILNGATKDGNKSIEELKRGTAQVEITKLEVLKMQTAENVSELRSMALDAQAVVKDFEAKEKRLEGRIKVLEKRLESVQVEYNGKRLTFKQLEKMRERFRENKIAQKIGTIAEVTGPKEDLENMFATASQKAKDSEEFEKTLAENKDLKKAVVKQKNQIKKLQEQIPVESIIEKGLRQTFERMNQKDKTSILNIFKKAEGAGLSKEFSDFIDTFERTLGNRASDYQIYQVLQQTMNDMQKQRPAARKKDNELS